MLQAIESALCSWLSGEAPWVAVAPIVGPVESDVVPHVVEDPVDMLCSVMCASSGVTNYMWVGSDHVGRARRAAGAQRLCTPLS